MEELESQVFNLKLAIQDYEDRLAKLYQTEDRSKWKGPAVLLNDLEAADRDVERLEDTIADLQDQLEGASRGDGNGTGNNGTGGGGDVDDEAVRAGSSATEGNDGDRGGDSGCSGGTQDRNWEARIAGVQERIAGLEEDNRVLTEAAGWEARDASEEEHELLTPAAKSQRRRAIDMLSERIRQLTELLKSSLGREDAARVAAEKISVDLDEAVARIEELEAALQRYRDLAVLAEERADAAQRKTEEERRTMDAGRVTADGAEPESERNTEEERRTTTDTRGVNTDAWALEAPEGLPADACERLERLEVDARRWKTAYVSLNDQLEDEKRLSNETDRRLAETEDSVRELTARLRERDRERSSDRSSSAEFEEVRRHGQLSREVADKEKTDGARGDDNETSGQAGTSLEERSSVGGKSPAESASTEDDAAWNRVRSSAETQRNDNGRRQEQWQQELRQQREDDGDDVDLSLSVLLDRDPGPESSTATSNAMAIGGNEDGAAAAGALPVSARATVTRTMSPVPELELELELESDAPILTPEGASGGLGGEGNYGAQKHYEEQELCHTSNSPSNGFEEVGRQADVSGGKFERLSGGEFCEDGHTWRSATPDGDESPTVDSLPQASEEGCATNISENDTEHRRVRVTGTDGVGDLQQQQQQQQDVQKGMVTFSRASIAGDRASLADRGKKSNTPASSEPSEIREGRRDGEGGDAKRPMSSGATTIVDGFPAGDERGMAAPRAENAARRAEAGANRANSSAENVRSDRLAAEPAASAVDVATAKAAMTLALTAPFHGSFDGASALLRRPPSAPQPTAVAAQVTVSNSAMIPTGRSVASADPMRASLESSRASIDGEDRGAAARLVSRASLVAKLDKLAADAAATKAMASPASSQDRASLGAAATPKRAIAQSPERSRVVGRSSRLDRSGSIDQVERVIAAVATRTSGSRGSSRVAEDYWQRPVAEAAATVSTTPQRPRRSPEKTPMPTTSTASPTFLSSGRERADKRGPGAIAVDERERRTSWSPASGAFVGPYGPDGTRSTVQQAAQMPTPAGASRTAPGRSRMGRGQAGSLTRSWLDDNSSADVRGRLADAFCDGRDVRDTRGRPPRATRCVGLGGETMAPSGRPKKKVKKKSRASVEVAAAPARREHHHAHAHRGPCARSCACSTCPCSDAPPSTSSAWHLRRRSLSVSRR